MARQRGTLIKRKNRYAIKYRTLAGKQKMESGFDTKAAAQARLNEVLLEINKSAYVEPKKIQFKTFAEEWLKSRVSIRGSTLSAYQSIVKQRLIPYFGKMSLSNIGFDQVQHFVSELSKEVSVKTVHNCVILLRVMLVGKKGASAIKRGHVRHDPTKGVELPAMEHEKIVPLTLKQVWKLIDSAKEVGGIGYGIVFIDAFTGLRRNEILALRFTDIDWLNREVAVSKAVSKFPAEDGAHKWVWKIGPPKSQKSNRRVALPQSVIELLSGLRQTAKGPEGLIFPGTNGHLMDPDYFNAEIFAPTAKHAGLEGVRFHDLRHFFASMLISQGESPKYVCDQMGHSSIQITFDTYGHLFPQAREEAAKKLQKAMFAGRKKPFGSNLVAKQARTASKEGGRARPN